MCMRFMILVGPIDYKNIITPDLRQLDEIISTCSSWRGLGGGGMCTCCPTLNLWSNVVQWNLTIIMVVHGLKISGFYRDGIILLGT